MIDRRTFLHYSSGLIGACAVSSLAPITLFASEDTFIPLVAKKGTAALATSEDGARPTQIWGYNGGVPGPTIRCKVGDRLKLRLINQLDQPTSIHWHGIRIDNAMDGVPGLTQKEVMPGDSFDYDFIVPDAGTYWYHTHSRSWEQMARGLYGLLIVENPDDPEFDQDIPLALDDWRLAPDGQIEEDSFGALHDWSHQGRLGNWLTVNGLSNPAIKLKTGQRIRLRLANTANARILKFAFENHDAMVIALDGRPIAPRPLKNGELELAPAQRADVSLLATGAPGSRHAIHETSYNKPFEFAHFLYEEEGGTWGTDREPLTLAAPTAPPQLDLATATTTQLIMTGGAMGTMQSARHNGQMMSMRDLIENNKAWAFNGVAGDLDIPLLETSQGRTIVIEIINDTSWPHAMHLHGHHFQVIERAGHPITNAPLRDTELMQPREKISIAFRADNPGKWLLHCHMIEHMAAGMVTWLKVNPAG